MVYLRARDWYSTNMAQSPTLFTCVLGWNPDIEQVVRLAVPSYALSPTGRTEAGAGAGAGAKLEYLPSSMHLQRRGRKSRDLLSHRLTANQRP